MAVTPRYVGNWQGRNEPTTVILLVDASQTINEGDILQINVATGKVQVAAAASTTVIGIAQQAITTGASPTANDKIPVITARDAIFRVNVTGGPVTQLAVLNTTPYDLSNKTTLNFADTTGGMFRIVAFDNTKNTADVVCSVGAF